MNWKRGRVIGRGSSATVYLAADENSGEAFAVKSTGISKSISLRREAELLSSLESNFTIGYRGCEITEEPTGEPTYNIFMEHAPNGTVADTRRIREPKIVHYTRQILQGLDYIHSNQIAHCDIKGTNILLGADGNAKIADFGCAKRVGYPGPDPAEPIRGTPAYMPPEAARGEDQGFEGDVWALGCTVIEMATGLPPWVNDEPADPVSVLFRVGFSGGLPEIPRFLSEKAKDFLDKCLKREPSERWTANQLLNHPFLYVPNILGNEIRFTKPNSSVSISPTSVADQRFWISSEETREESFEDLDRPIRGRIPHERIGRLSLVSAGPGWFSGDETWMTVRVVK